MNTQQIYYNGIRKKKQFFFNNPPFHSCKQAYLFREISRISNTLHFNQFELFAYTIRVPYIILYFAYYTQYQSSTIQTSISLVSNVKLVLSVQSGPGIVSAPFCYGLWDFQPRGVR